MDKEWFVIEMDLADIEEKLRDDDHPLAEPLMVAIDKVKALQDG